MNIPAKMFIVHCSLFNCHLKQKTWNDAPLGINGLDTEDCRDRRRHIQPADDGRSIHTFVEIRSPKNAGHAVRVVETLGVMQLATAVDFIIASELRAKDECGIAAEAGMTLHPIQQRTHL